MKDTCLTYCGYKRFLENDLRFIFPLSKFHRNKVYKGDVALVAREMIARGQVCVIRKLRIESCPD